MIQKEKREVNKLPQWLEILKNDKEIGKSKIPASKLKNLKELYLVVEQPLIMSKGSKIVIKNEKKFNSYYNKQVRLLNAHSRKEIQNVSNDTKTKKSSPMDGYYIKMSGMPDSFQNCMFIKDLNDLKPIIQRNDKLKIIIIENFENMYQPLEIEDALLIWRNASKEKDAQTIIEFLYKLKLTSSQKVFYFGDYDFAGVSIFFSYKEHINHIEMYIPDNIEELLKHNGNGELYKKQLIKYKKKDTKHSKLLNDYPLVELFHKYQKVYEQENVKLKGI